MLLEMFPVSHPAVEAPQPENPAVLTPGLPVAGFELRTSSERRMGCYCSINEQSRSKLWEFLAILANATVVVVAEFHSRIFLLGSAIGGDFT